MRPKKTKPVLKPLHILIDMDEVTCQLHKPWEKWIQENGDPDFKWLSVESWYVDQYTKIGKKCYGFLDNTGIFLDLEPVPDAIKFINILRNDGHRIQFCTQPPGKDEESVNRVKAEKIAWLQHHFKKWFNPETDIIFSHDKSLCNGDILIDDRAKWLIEFPGTSIGLATNYNKKFPGFRVETWQEIYNLVSKVSQYAA